MKDLQNLHIHI